MYHGSRNILSHTKKIPCKDFDVADVYYDVNFRAEVDRIAFQFLLPFVPSLKP